MAVSALSQGVPPNCAANSCAFSILRVNAETISCRPEAVMALATVLASVPVPMKHHLNALLMVCLRQKVYRPVVTVSFRPSGRRISASQLTGITTSKANLSSLRRHADFTSP